MKKIALILSLFTLNCYAITISCIDDDGEIFYNHHIYEAQLVDGKYFYRESKKSNVVYIASDCIIKLENDDYIQLKD